MTSPAEVQVKVRDAAVKVLARQLDNLLAGKVTRKPQVHQAATKFGRRKPQDGEIDWTRPAGDVHNLVRAVSHPYPGAFTTVGPHTLHIWRTKRVDAPAGAPRAVPGGVHLDGRPAATSRAATASGWRSCGRRSTTNPSSRAACSPSASPSSRPFPRRRPA